MIGIDSFLARRGLNRRRATIALAKRRRLPFHSIVKPGRALLDMGAGNCSDAQLLAILLGSGGRGYSALDSANALLDKYGTLAGMMNRPLNEVAQVRGIKAVRAIRLAAAYEICQRLLKEVARDA
jgi:DNA repair protein RadC